jgi:hypothetical protein
MMWITGKKLQIPEIGSGKKFWRNILFFKLSHNSKDTGGLVFLVSGPELDGQDLA